MKPRLVPFALAFALVSCTASPGPAPGERRGARRPLEGDCKCAHSGDEGEECECPHCASMGSGMSPGECPCARRSRR